jgi:trypsin
MRHRILIPSLYILLLAACSAPPATDPFDGTELDGAESDAPELDSLEQAIVNGHASESSTDDTAVYVRGHWAGEAVACTGTLIAPNLVATALHCITETPSGACTTTAQQCFSCNSDGSLKEDSLYGRIGPLMDAANVNVTVGSQIAGVAPSAQARQLIGSGSTQICRGDIGFIVLDHDLDAPVTPVRLDWGIETGDTVRILGYGETEVSGTSGRRARTGVRVTEVGPASEDEPTITAAPRTFIVNEGPCHGDSGGPALAEDTGALVGVYSLTAGQSCTGIGVRNIYTSLPLFANVARQAFQVAGHDPILDPEPPKEERPPVVPDSGCALGDSTTRLPTPLLLALAALGLVRRRRA